MEVFSNFYCATIAVLLAILSISLPVLFFLKIYLIIREPFVNKYADIEDFEDKPEIVIELLSEFKKYLEKIEDYEKVKEVNEIYLQFQKRKITIEKVFDSFEPVFEDIENGDSRINPERTAVITDSYSYSDGDESIKVTEYCYLKFKKRLSIKDFFKRFLFS
jgi:hypothetical protein